MIGFQGDLFTGISADWLGTFVLHSTCALAFALLVSLVLRDRSIVIQERLLRLALWLPFVSATAQQFGVGRVWAVAWRDAPMPVATDLSNQAALFATQLTSLNASPVDTEQGFEVAWSWIVLGLVTCSALLGLRWLWRSHAQLRRVLVAREPVVDARVLTVAATVARSLGMLRTPQLSSSATLATPIAFGWLRPEICLPQRATSMADGSLRAMLAHELAHLRRGDPAWMWFAATLQAVMPWQPLLWIVRSRWSRLVELRCDAIAARETSPAAVARCLLDVAEWLRPRSPVQVVALGMAARPSALRARVEAALSARPEGRSTVAGAIVCSLGLLLTLTFAAPGVARDGELRAPFALAELDVEAAEPGTLAFALSMLDREHQELRQTAAQLLRDADPDDPTFQRLAALCKQRFARLERLRERLQTAIERRDSSRSSR